MNKSAFGIDLGTGNIKIYNGMDDSILNERNMIAIKDRDTLFAYGDSAYDMFEKAPENIEISYPLNFGVIADIANMETVFSSFVDDVSHGNFPSDIYIAVPTDITEVSRKAFYDLVLESDLNPKRVMVVEKAVADALGLGVDIRKLSGMLVVNVGFETTEISLLSLGGIVISRLYKIGGSKFDSSIMTAVRKQYDLFIGSKSAEQLRMNIHDSEKTGEDGIVFGRDMYTGLPTEKKISTTLINECIEEHFYSIAENIKVLVEHTPPEIRTQIYKDGIYLTGGASKTGHLANILAKETELKVNMAQNYKDSVVCGLARIIKDEKFKHIAYQIQSMSKR